MKIGLFCFIAKRLAASGRETRPLQNYFISNETAEHNSEFRFPNLITVSSLLLRAVKFSCSACIFSAEVAVVLFAARTSAVGTAVWSALALLALITLDLYLLTVYLRSRHGIAGRSGMENTAMICAAFSRAMTTLHTPPYSASAALLICIHQISVRTLL